MEITGLAEEPGGGAAGGVGEGALADVAGVVLAHSAAPGGGAASALARAAAAAAASAHDHLALNLLESVPYNTTFVNVTQHTSRSNG